MWDYGVASGLLYYCVVGGGYIWDYYCVVGGLMYCCVWEEVDICGVMVWQMVS